MSDLLTIRGLSAGYGLLRVLHEIDFSVGEGERIGLVGLNGHGKTTLRDHLKSLITPELIEEHRQKPLGQHSDALDRVLNYFRRGDMADKYAILRRAEDYDSYSVVALSGARGAPPRIVDDRIYRSIDEAYHAVFLLRVNDLMES